MDEIIKKLMEDPLVYYIYQTDLSIFGLNDNLQYTIITEPNFQMELDPIRYIHYTTTDWFNMVLNNSLITWICSCLPKQYIIKEYVKLLIPLDILKLRRNILRPIYEIEPTEPYKSEYIYHIIHLNLVNQIVENHKIVNYLSCKKDCENVLSQEDYYSTRNKYREIISRELERFHNLTDGIYKQQFYNKDE